ncbi:MAG: 3-hydroxyacyl-ACP dehydratase FabZ [Elusimicrobiota bacterium]|jgi:3-hydroxyacyl-[acyl-carrier-protein] dehydratase|nr:3-hydroxyacyl-ACP dehydratase FabZ [Elusimicrobiota bacterium]
MGKLEFLLKEEPQDILERPVIEQNIPHRDPFLFVDEVYLFEDKKYLMGLRRFTGEEPFFKGHFPKYPVVPGVMILEAMAQTVGAAVMQSPKFKTLKGKVAFFASIEQAKFRKQVAPGDLLKIVIELQRVGKITKIYGEAYTYNGLCTEAVLNFIVGDKD